jgi:hypothetical protein
MLGANWPAYPGTNASTYGISYLIPDTAWGKPLLIKLQRVSASNSKDFEMHPVRSLMEITPASSPSFITGKCRSRIVTINSKALPTVVVSAAPW